MILIYFFEGIEKESKLAQIVPNVLVFNLDHDLIDRWALDLCLVNIDLELVLYTKFMEIIKIEHAWPWRLVLSWQKWRYPIIVQAVFWQFHAA